MIGQRDTDRVEVATREQFLEVIVNGAVAAAVSPVDGCLRVHEMVLVDIAKRDDLHIGAQQELTEVLGTLPAQPDCAEHDSFAWRRPAFRACDAPAKDGGSNDGPSRCLQECATVDLVCHVVPLGVPPGWCLGRLLLKHATHESGIVAVRHTIFQREATSIEYRVCLPITVLVACVLFYSGAAFAKQERVDPDVITR